MYKTMMGVPFPNVEISTTNIVHLGKVRIIILLSGIQFVCSLPQNNYPNYQEPSKLLLPPLAPPTISTRILPPLHSNIYTNGLPESNGNLFNSLNTPEAENYYANDRSSAGSYYHNPFLNNFHANENPTKILDPPPVKVPVSTQRPVTSTTTKEPIILQRPNAPLSLAEWENYNIREPYGPGTYAWGYDIEDPQTGNVQFRSEERHANGTVTGSYGYLEPNGNVRVTHYIADGRGYRTRVENSQYKSLLPSFRRAPTTQQSPSPQLLAAIQSQKIQQQNPNYSIRDQYQRPIDQQYQATNDNAKFNYFFIPTDKQF
ncbi:uncharacterized protein LOC123292212 [Chrysoperla carnea]|uniref:uncharacterized protein LOC123292212 n=1 Tax=Chrysoperla carnea TaxID=189513 RepID=UPI001D0938E6|nr:uncharacterized protein LOC123292212 [Chrysoperla carnea]